MSHRLASASLTLATLLLGLPVAGRAATPPEAFVVDIAATQTGQAGDTATRRVEHYKLSLNGRGDSGEINTETAGTEKTRVKLRIIPDGGPSLGFEISRYEKRGVSCSAAGEVVLPAPGGTTELARIACGGGELELVLSVPKR